MDDSLEKCAQFTNFQKNDLHIFLIIYRNQDEKLFIFDPTIFNNIMQRVKSIEINYYFGIRKRKHLTKLKIKLMEKIGKLIWSRSLVDWV
jgi:hypothetical protein